MLNIKVSSLDGYLHPGRKAQRARLPSPTVSQSMLSMQPEGTRGILDTGTSEGAPRKSTNAKKQGVHSSQSPVKAAAGSKEEKRLTLDDTVVRLRLGFSVLDITDKRFRQQFDAFVTRQISDASVKKLKRNFHEEGVLTHIEPIPVLVSQSDFDPASVSQDPASRLRAPGLKWTKSAIKRATIDFLAGMHRFQAVFEFIKEKRKEIAKLRKTQGQAKAKKDPIYHQLLEVQMEEADRRIRFATRWPIVLICRGKCGPVSLLSPTYILRCRVALRAPECYRSWSTHLFQQGVTASGRECGRGAAWNTQAHF